MSGANELNRRKFLRTSAAGICSAGIIGQNSSLLSEEIQERKVAKINSYRTLGRTEFKASDIGFGAGIQIEPAVLHSALERGINYIDTGEHYVGGRSESTIGDVIGKHDRKSIFITTKINISRGVQTKDTIKSRFLKCLERLKTDYVDCLMIHMATMEQIRHEGFHSAYSELKSEGKVRFFGLSNHGKEQSIYGRTVENMEDVILAAADDGRFDVALFVYNFLQKEQGEKIIRKCKEKNMGATLMKTNPVGVFQRASESDESRKQRGRDISEARQKMMNEYEDWLKRTEEFRKKHKLTTNNQLRDAAIKFTLAHPDVHSVCPSIRNFEELDAFLALSGSKLTTSEGSTLSDYENTLGRFYCRHACALCESECPDNVPVNTIMRYNHYFTAQNREKHAMSKYAKLKTTKADNCINCEGHCEKSCPHNVPVHSLLVNAHNNLTLG